MTVATLVIGSVHATTLEWLDAAGRARRTIIAKTTYALAPTTSPLVDPIPICESDDHWNDDAARSVVAPSDLAPFKPSAEVTLVGRAFAPGGKPVTSLLARLVVSEIDKAIEVFGDRAVTALGELEAITPFRQMPLRWERAAGGAETANPVGLRGADASGRRTLPNLVHPSAVIERGDEALAPIGFGPIAPDWPERAARRGTGAIDFTRPLPKDLVPSHFIAAPSDQRCASLRADERIVLENLHRDYERLVTNLEAAAIDAFVERSNGSAAALELTPDTLWIDSDRGIATLTRRRTVEADATPTRVLVSQRTPSERPSYELVARAIDGGWSSPGATEIEETMVPESGARGPTALPFSHGVSPLAAPSPAPSGPRRSNTLVGEAPRDPDTLPFAERGARNSSPQIAADAARGSLPAPPAMVRDASLLPEPEWRVERASPWALGPSNAAVDQLPSAQAAASPAPVEAAPAPALAKEPAKEPAPAATAKPVIELLWLEDSAAPRIRRTFRSILEGIDLDPDDAENADDPKLDAHDVLVNAPARDDRGVSEAIDGAINARGRFVPPIVVVGGALVFRFSEIDLLRAMIELANPFGAADKRTREALDEAKKVADSATIQASLAVDAALTRVRELVFIHGKQEGLDAIQAVAERSLVQSRQYLRRTVFGGDFIRCNVVTSQRNVQIAGYIPATIASTLPQFVQLPARVIAEAHLPQEQSDTSPASLRILAFGRVLADKRAPEPKQPKSSE